MKKTFFILLGLSLLILSCGAPSSSNSKKNTNTGPNRIVNLENLIGKNFAGRLYVGNGGNTTYTAGTFIKKNNLIYYVEAEQVNAAGYYGYPTEAAAIKGLSASRVTQMPTNPVPGAIVELGSYHVGSSTFTKTWLKFGPTDDSFEFYLTHPTTGQPLRGADLRLKN
ncbi:MAG: hypothetical protein ACRCVN_04140 [Spirochaetia bacterium]